VIIASLLRQLVAIKTPRVFASYSPIMSPCSRRPQAARPSWLRVSNAAATCPLAGMSSPSSPSPSRAPCAASCADTCHRRSSSVGLPRISGRRVPRKNRPECIHAATGRILAALWSLLRWTGTDRAEERIRKPRDSPGGGQKSPSEVAQPGMPGLGGISGKIPASYG
jgi:hypothetical protein